METPYQGLPRRPRHYALPKCTLPTRQAEDRAHRIGQAHSHVSIQFLLVGGGAGSMAASPRPGACPAALLCSGGCHIPSRALAQTMAKRVSPSPASSPLQPSSRAAGRRRPFIAPPPPQLHDSVDEMMWDTLQSKLVTTGQVLDGQAANFQVGAQTGL